MSTNNKIGLAMVLVAGVTAIVAMKQAGWPKSLFPPDRYELALVSLESRKLQDSNDVDELLLRVGGKLEMRIWATQGLIQDLSYVRPVPFDDAGPLRILLTEIDLAKDNPNDELGSIEVRVGDGTGEQERQPFTGATGKGARASYVLEYEVSER